MPRFEVPDILLGVAEVNEPGAGFCGTCAVPVSVPEPAIEVVADWLDANTV